MAQKERIAERIAAREAGGYTSLFFHERRARHGEAHAESSLRALLERLA
jgi:hypothetical protein